MKDFKEQIALEKPYENFLSNIEKIDKIVNVGSEIGNLVVNFLDSLSKNYEKMEGFHEYKRKLNRVVDLIKDIKGNVGLKSSFNAIYNQSLVLVVSNFESFLNEFYKMLFDEYPFLINWPENKIGIDVSIFNYSTPTTGDLILRALKEKYSFQDLKSTIEFAKKFTEVEIDLTTQQKDNIIFYQGVRHAIIHNSAKADHGLIKQLRGTQYFFAHSEGDDLIITDKDYDQAKKEFLNIAETITRLTKNRLNEIFSVIPQTNQEEIND
jgi:hypothetical protein